MRALLIGVGGIVLLANLSATAAAPPKLKDYPAAMTFKGKPAAPELSKPKARMFRTELRRQAATGPNFAGHFTLALWACGTGCNTIAVIDATSGAVYTPAIQFDSVFNRAGQVECYISSRFELGSELFVAQGMLDDKVGRHYFRWKDGGFTLVHFEPTCVESADEF